METTELVHQVRATRDERSWIREKAVVTLVTEGYGYLVDHETLSSIPVRNRYKGKFCSTRHVESLHGVVQDSDHVSHSVWFCPAAVNETGNGSWRSIKDHDGWLCEVCIHMKDWSEVVQSQQFDKFLAADTIQTSKRAYSVPSGERAQKVLKVLGSLTIASMDEIVQECSNVWAVGEDARRDVQTTSNTVYRLAKTGVIQKFGRGSKAVYSYT